MLGRPPECSPDGTRMMAGPVPLTCIAGRRVVDDLVRRAPQHLADEIFLAAKWR